MKIKVEFYKPSGKFYTAGTATLPDDVYIWTPNIRQLILANQDCLSSKTDDGYWTIVTDNIDENYAKGAFFKHTYKGVAHKKENLDRRLDSLLSRCENGKEMYLNSSIFKAAITCIIRGHDPIESIQEICVMFDNSQKAMKEYIELNPNPDFLTKK